MSNNYEPELMYALDSKGEYSDWKNVYNVSGDDVCYCPICLGRVKLWNGQDPDRNYKKQRCFHHIDGMCSQESRIHFAYKTWLLEPNSKFKIDDNIYEVKNANIEKTLNTTYGNYIPDIVIETVDGKIFYVEVADTNKKTDDYILKWDELGNDVIEIDVNEQLVFATIKDIPVFNMIYSSATGECHIKKYVKQDYDELLSERKIYWKRKDLLNYKIKWEKLDWFWRGLQNYYFGKSTLEEVCEDFSNIDLEDQKFICTRFKNGKHRIFKERFCQIINDNFVDELKKSILPNNEVSFEIKQISKRIYSFTCLYLGKSLWFACGQNKIYVKNGLYELKYNLNLYDIRNEIVENYNVAKKEYEEFSALYNLIEKSLSNYSWFSSIALDRYDNRYINIIIDYNDDKINFKESYRTRLKDKNDFYIKSEDIVSLVVSHFDYLLLKEQNSYNRKIREENAKTPLDLLISKVTKHLHYIYPEDLINQLDLCAGFAWGVLSDPYIQVIDNYFHVTVYFKPNIDIPYEEQYDDLLKFLSKRLTSIENTKIKIDENKKKFQSYVELINNCKNNYWSISFDYYQEHRKFYVDYTLKLCVGKISETHSDTISLTNSRFNYEKHFLEVMKSFLQKTYYYNYKEYRLMEV